MHISCSNHKKAVTEVVVGPTSDSVPLLTLDDLTPDSSRNGHPVANEDTLPLSGRSSSYPDLYYQLFGEKSATTLQVYFDIA